jgi:hypothetical protein
VHEYSITGWDSFFVAEVGAAAALTGLLFVAISINLQKILQFPWLPGRAATAVVVLVNVLIVASFGLVPGQSSRLLGAEVLVCGAVTLLFLMRFHFSTRSAEIEGGVQSVNQMNLQVAVAGATATLFVLGGASLLARWGGGLYWLVPAVVMSFVLAMAYAWVLMIEIQR